MKSITKKLMASAVSAVLSLTAVVAFAAPAAPVLAATNNPRPSYSVNYRDDMRMYELKKEEGVKFLQNCVSNPSPAAVALTNEYVWEIYSHPYDISKTLDQNINELVRYVNNVYKNIQRVDNTSKFEAYKTAKLNYLYSLADSEEDYELVDYVAYAFSYITYDSSTTLEIVEGHIDQLTAIAERELLK